MILMLLSKTWEKKIVGWNLNSLMAFPIGPEKDCGPVVHPSSFTKRWRSGSSLPWKMTPPLFPKFVLVPSDPTIFKCFALLKSHNFTILPSNINCFWCFRRKMIDIDISRMCHTHVMIFHYPPDHFRKLYKFALWNEIWGRRVDVIGFQYWSLVYLSNEVQCNNESQSN